jgi:hypothetical protein
MLKKKRGGAREGSGRKPAGTVSITIRALPFERTFLDEVAELSFRGNRSAAFSSAIASFAALSKETHTIYKAAKARSATAVDQTGSAE